MFDAKGVPHLNDFGMATVLVDEKSTKTMPNNLSDAHQNTVHMNRRFLWDQLEKVMYIHSGHHVHGKFLPLFFSPFLARSLSGYIDPTYNKRQTTAFTCLPAVFQVIANSGVLLGLKDTGEVNGDFGHSKVNMDIRGLGMWGTRWKYQRIFLATASSARSKPYVDQGISTQLWDRWRPPREYASPVLMSPRAS